MKMTARKLFMCMSIRLFQFFSISAAIISMRVWLGKTRLHDFFQIYRPINVSGPPIWSFTFDLVITFDWRVLLRPKNNASELHFARSFQGHPTWPYLARLNMHIWPYLLWRTLDYMGRLPPCCRIRGPLDIKAENHWQRMRTLWWPSWLEYQPDHPPYIGLLPWCLFLGSPHHLPFQLLGDRDCLTGGLGWLVPAAEEDPGARQGWHGHNQRQEETSHPH